jgi:hypothetical protein
VREAGDQTVVIWRVTGRGKASGVPLDQGAGQVRTWRDGMLWRNVARSNAAEALEAVGSS